VSLKWNGKAVLDHVLVSTATAGNSILADCVVEAKQLVPVRTTHLQGSIQMREMAMTSKSGMRGVFGSFAMHYALYVEKGTLPHVILPRVKHALFWEGAAHPMWAVHHPGTQPRPFLQPAADKYFPQFAQRIKEQMKRG
jgi:hypothetical protein